MRHSLLCLFPKFPCLCSLFKMPYNLLISATKPRLYTQMPSKSEGLMLKASYAKILMKKHCSVLYFRVEQIALNERLEEVWLQA